MRHLGGGGVVRCVIAHKGVLSWVSRAWSHVYVIVSTIAFSVLTREMNHDTGLRPMHRIVLDLAPK